MELCCRWHWRSLLALPLSLAVAVLLLAAAVPPAAAQMLSPLAGQNSPNLNTTEVFMSVYLDRLLEGGWWQPLHVCNSLLATRNSCVPSGHNICSA